MRRPEPPGGLDMIPRAASRSGTIFGRVAVKESAAYPWQSRIPAAVPAIRTRCQGYSTAETAIATRSPPVFDNPNIDRLKDELTLAQPCFGVRGDEVEVLYEPQAFHEKLLVSRPHGTRNNADATTSAAYVAECQTANHDIHAIHRRRTTRAGR